MAFYQNHSGYFKPKLLVTLHQIDTNLRFTLTVLLLVPHQELWNMSPLIGEVLPDHLVDWEPLINLLRRYLKKIAKKKTMKTMTSKGLGLAFSPVLEIWSKSLLWRPLQAFREKSTKLQKSIFVASYLFKVLAPFQSSYPKKNHHQPKILKTTLLQIPYIIKKRI